MLISLISAMAHHRVIGFKNQLPWHLPADLKHFKAITLDKPILMGRKTFESIGRPLPGRKNIILSRATNLIISGCEVANSLQAALSLARPAEELMVIGGAEIYKACLPLADRLYLTLIDLEAEGDTYFPEWKPEEWKEINRETHSPDANNSYAYTFLTLSKLAPRAKKATIPATMALPS